MIKDGKAHCDECGEELVKAGSARVLAGKLVCSACHKVLKRVLPKNAPHWSQVSDLGQCALLAHTLIILHWILVLATPLVAIVVWICTRSLLFALITLVNVVGPLTFIVLLRAARETFDWRREECYRESAG